MLRTFKHRNDYSLCRLLVRAFGLEYYKIRLIEHLASRQLASGGFRRLNSTKAEIRTITTLVKSCPLATSPTYSSADSRELSLPPASIFTFDPGLLQPTERTHLRTPTSLFVLLDIGWSPASDSEAGGMCFRRGGEGTGRGPPLNHSTPLCLLFALSEPTDSGWHSGCIVCRASWLVIERDWCQTFYHLRTSGMDRGVWHTYHLPETSGLPTLSGTTNRIIQQFHRHHGFSSCSSNISMSNDISFTFFSRTSQPLASKHATSQRQAAKVTSPLYSTLRPPEFVYTFSDQTAHTHMRLNPSRITLYQQRTNCRRRLRPSSKAQVNNHLQPWRRSPEVLHSTEAPSP